MEQPIISSAERHPPFKLAWAMLLLLHVPVMAAPPSHTVTLASAPAQVVPTSAWHQMLTYIQKTAYQTERVAMTGEGGIVYVAQNPRHHLHVRFTSTGVSVEPMAESSLWSWGLAVDSWGRGDQLIAAKKVAPVVANGQVKYERGDLTEWYVNDSSGIEQGFTITKRPAGEGALRVKLFLTGTLIPELAQDGLVLRNHARHEVLSYGGLLAWDANGRDLVTRMDFNNGILTLEVEDTGAIYPVTIDPTIINEDAKLLPSDGTIRDGFGEYVSMSEDTIVVGAPRGGFFNQFGSAYVFVKPEDGWTGILTEAAKLIPSNRVPVDLFGQSVSISGDTIVVGAQWDDDIAPLSGTAYVFVKPENGWAGTLNETARLQPSDSAEGDRFGVSVSISGGVIVVGAWVDDDAAGSAYVFVEPIGGWNGMVSESAKLQASKREPFDLFGVRVSHSGNTIAVASGSNDDITTGTTAIYVFVEPASGWDGTITESGKLLASDGEPLDSFGTSISVWGNTIAVGASGDGAGNWRAGSVYIFTKPFSGWAGTLFERAKLLASDGSSSDRLGLTLAATNHMILAGVRDDDDNGLSSGSVYVFSEPDFGWSNIVNESFKLLASDGDRFDNFGFSIAMSGTTVVASARASILGSAYVFELDEAPVSLCRNVASPADPVTCTANASVYDGPFDPEGDEIILVQTPPGPYPLGDTLVTLTIQDSSGTITSCQATVRVLDTTPPEISVGLEPRMLWPPNHRLTGIEASVTAADACGPARIELTSISSNEPDDDTGGGTTSNDVKLASFGSADFEFDLRAERSGVGSGRTYTVVFTAIDTSGNTATDRDFVLVPHDQGGVVEPITLAVRENGRGTHLEWTRVPGALFYNVIRGHVSAIYDNGLEFDLGGTACIEAASLDTSTLGREDTLQPSPNEAIFYLVEYFDGQSSGFGTESAAQPRSITDGCDPSN